MIQYIRDLYNYYYPASIPENSSPLVALPEDLQQIIIESLINERDASSLGSLAKTCRIFNRLITETNISLATIGKEFNSDIDDYEFDKNIKIIITTPETISKSYKNNSIEDFYISGVKKYDSGEESEIISPKNLSKNSSKKSVFRKMTSPSCTCKGSRLRSHSS